MHISKTSQYAIQVMVYLATHGPEFNIKAHDIARQLDMPTSSVAMIMQMLTKGKLVRSSRGPLGGYCLLRGSGHINLMQILMITEGVDYATKGLLCKRLKQQTLQALSEAVLAGEYRIEDLPQMMQSDFAF